MKHLQNKLIPILVFYVTDYHFIDKNALIEVLCKQ